MIIEDTNIIDLQNKFKKLAPDMSIEDLIENIKYYSNASKFGGNSTCSIDILIRALEAKLTNDLEYPKINTLWKRDENNKYCITPGDFSDSEFENIKLWHVTEKIDGTNVRIFWNGTNVRFGGRTENAQMPTILLDHLMNTFTVELMQKTFPDITPDSHEELVLFGEGYGPKIQKGGGLYRSDVSFILFDVLIQNWWLERKNVKDIAQKLGIDIVPTLGIWTIDEIVEYVKSMPQSEITSQEKIVEGVVARSHPLVLYRNGKPLMFKLKTKDYTKLEKVNDAKETTL